LQDTPYPSLGKVVLKAFAKVNLYLDVLEARPDGFHDIVTLFSSITLHDTITVEPTDGPTDFQYRYDPSMHNPGILQWDASNALFRVLREVEQFLGRSVGSFRLHLEKRIPPQSGLGGASADAAAFLRFLAQRFSIPPAATKKMALATGSDVPFQLHGGVALGKGRGEYLDFLPDLPSLPLLLVQPPFSFSTRRMYQHIDALRFEEWQNEEVVEHVEDFEEIPHSEERALSEELEEWENGGGEDWHPVDEVRDLFEDLSRQSSALTFNDFEQVASELFPEYEAFQQSLREVVSPSILLKSMTGSGSAHFVLFRENTPREDLQHWASFFQNRGCWVNLCALKGREEPHA